MTEIFRDNLDSAGELTEVILNALSLVFIIAGVIASMVKSFRDRNSLKRVHPLHTYFRIAFGGWLVVALEFQLAGDIVGTIISPTSTHLIELGAVAFIRNNIS